jgi:hypothetical protein
LIRGWRCAAALASALDDIGRLLWTNFAGICS